MDTIFKDPLNADIATILNAALTLQLLITNFHKEGSILQIDPKSSELSPLSLVYTNTYAAYKLQCCCSHSAEEETQLSEIKKIFQNLADNFGVPQISLFNSRT